MSGFMKDSNSDGLDEIIASIPGDWRIYSEAEKNLKQQLTAYINEVVQEVIGEDEPLIAADDFQKRSLEIRRNELRAEQRTKAKKLMGEG